LNGFFLGFSNGLLCLGSCAPVLILFLLGEGEGIRENCASVGLFLFGRLWGYMVFAVLAWAASASLLHGLPFKSALQGISYIILAIVLAVYSFLDSPHLCAANTFQSFVMRKFDRYPWIFLILMGFLTGINLCPPFLLALIQSSVKESLWQSLLFFFTFFLGTSVYFIATVFAGFFSSFRSLRTVGRLTALVVACYYLYLGIVILLCHKEVL